MEGCIILFTNWWTKFSCQIFWGDCHCTWLFFILCFIVHLAVSLTFISILLNSAVVKHVVSKSLVERFMFFMFSLFIQSYCFTPKALFGVERLWIKFYWKKKKEKETHFNYGFLAIYMIWRDIFKVVLQLNLLNIL